MNSLYELYGSSYLLLTDFFMVPLMLLIIYVFAKQIALSNRDKPIYNFFVSGLMLKMFGGLLVCIVYMYYYQGGDTMGYFADSVCMAKLMLFDITKFLYVMGVDPNLKEMYIIFDFYTQYPSYLKDINAFFVVKLITPFTVLTMHSYLLTTLFVGCITFSGNWKLYKVLCDYYPKLYKEIGYAIFFIPSVAFWGAGILKDSITLSALGWYLWGFYFGVIKRKNPITGIIAIIISSYIIYKIKVYILVAVLPGSMIWLLGSGLKVIQNKMARAFLMVPAVAIGLLIGYNMLSSMNQYLGEYSTDKVFKKAAVNQYDLKQAHYGGNSFDIGGFDPTIEGVTGKAHLAITAGLFRPFIWEAKNPMMLISGIENIFLLFFTIYLLIKKKIFGFFSTILQDPMLTFSFIFAVIFAFGVGLSTSNFGSLVRYRIPLMPFYILVLVILYKGAEETKPAPPKKTFITR